ncbi:MAG TPA: AMP-dependent synthetase/ligase [Pseudonocardia sp.]
MNPADTVPGAFAATVARQGGEVALRAWTAGGWVDTTWNEYADRACRVAAALRSLGLRRGDRVALMIRNRAEFWPADMGVQLAGGTPVSIYNSSPPERIASVIDHAGIQLAIVEDTFLERFTAARAKATATVQVVTIGSDRDLTLDMLLDASPLDLDDAAAAVRPDDLATVIYTSGTTGDPKGVMITQANVVAAAGVLHTVLGRSLRGLRQVSYLPMAHIAERTATLYLHAAEGSVVHCCPDLADLPETLRRVQPEWFVAAPRFWEKLQAGIQASVDSDPATAEGFGRAREAGWRKFLAQGAGEPSDAETAALRQRFVRPVLEQVGLGSLSVAIAGAAPVPRHLSEFFLSLGIPFSEAWGMSETTGTGTWSPRRIVPGTAGAPVPGLEVRLGHDDEVLVRGPFVCRGYLHDPARTAEAIDPDGWLHTGDVGRFDTAGNLTIVDRLKEILVPSSGHNVSPAQIEAALKQSPLIGQACVFGSGRPHLVALLVLDPDGAATWARSHGETTTRVEELATRPALRADIEAVVAGVNAGLPPAERVLDFELLPDEWLPDSELLTLTAKLKRRGIEARYASVIDGLYPGGSK